MKHKVKVTIVSEQELEIEDAYVDPDENDYPYDEQIADEIVNDLVESDTWAELLSAGNVTVEISD